MVTLKVPGGRVRPLGLAQRVPALAGPSLPASGPTQRERGSEAGFVAFERSTVEAGTVVDAAPSLTKKEDSQREQRAVLASNDPWF
jgi:hypothetical protein